MENEPWEAVLVKGMALLWDQPFVDRRGVFRPKSVWVRRAGPRGGLTDVCATAEGLTLEPGEIPVFFNHDESECIGWVDTLASSKRGLAFTATVLPVLWGKQCRMFELTGRIGVSPSLHKLDYEQRHHSEAEPDVCVKAIMTELSLTWLPACVGGTFARIVESTFVRLTGEL